ncbi:MAG: hypothetical protein ACRCTZ_01330 [Sarcina sp.]
MDNLEKKLRDNVESKLPKNIDDVIENTLSSLEDKPKKRKYKKGVMVASLSAIILSGIGLGVVAIENDFSVKHMVYSLLGNESVDGIVEDKLLELGAKQSIDGIDFEVVKAGYYDSNILFSYKITSKKFVEYLKKEQHGQYIAVPTVMYKDERINGSIKTGFEIKSDTEVVGTFDIELKKFNEIRESDFRELTLIMDVYTKKDKNTEFRVNISMEEEMFIEGTKTYKVDAITMGESKSGIKYNNKITELVIDPLNVQLKYKSLENGQGDILDYILFDEKGKELKGSHGGYNGENGYINYDLNYDLNKIYIVPAISLKYLKDLERELKVNIKRGKITVEENEDFKVKTEKMDGFTRVTLIANTEYLSWPPSFIESREKWELQSVGKLKIDESQRAYANKSALNEVYYDISDDIKDGDYMFDYQDLSRFEFLKNQIVEVDLEK